MSYESLADIFTEMDEARARFSEGVARLSLEQAASRANAGAWSVSEIVEHVCIVEHQIARLLSKLLSKAEERGEQARADGRIETLRFEPVIERSAREKYNAPESARPSGNQTIADSLALMDKSHAAILELRPRMEATNLCGVAYPHPVFGPFDSYQWLVLIGFHEGRHLKQIEATLAANQS